MLNIIKHNKLERKWGLVPQSLVLGAHKGLFGCIWHIGHLQQWTSRDIFCSEPLLIFLIDFCKPSTLLPLWLCFSWPLLWKCPWLNVVFFFWFYCDEEKDQKNSSADARLKCAKCTWWKWNCSEKYANRLSTWGYSYSVKLDFLFRTLSLVYFIKWKLLQKNMHAAY